MPSSARALASVFLLLALMPIPGPAAVPQTLSLQGLLTNSSGQPLTGSYDLVFRIYSVPAGGSALYTETQPNIPVVDGAFSVVLGKTALLNLPFDIPYYIGTSLDGDTELSPRLELTAVAYSLNARTVQDNAITSAKVADNSLTSADIADGQLKAADLAAGQVVRTFNNLRDHVVLVGGPNVAVTTDPSINQIAIAFSGAASAVGDLTAITAGPGLTGGGTSGSVSLALATGGVNSGHLADGTINTVDLAPNAVTTTRIADGAVTGADLASGSVSSAKILAGAVTTTHLADATVATADLADNAVTTAKVVDGSLTGADIAADQVVKSLNAIRENVTLVGGNGITVTPKPNNREIAISFSGAFSTAGSNTSSGDITAVTAGSGLTGGGTGGAVTLGLATAGVTSQHLADGAITGTKIADGSIVSADLANDSIVSFKIVDGTIATNDLANNAVTGAKVLDYSLTQVDLVDNIISSAKVGDGSLGAIDIAGGQVLKSLNNLRDNAALVAGPRLSVTTNPATNQIIVGLTDTTSSSGDITVVTAGPGLTGGGTGGAVSLALATGGVTAQHLADNTVTSAKIADGTITTNDIADHSITSLDIATGNVVTALAAGPGLNAAAANTSGGVVVWLADGGVSEKKIADNAITSTKIADNIITGTDIADRTITGNDILGGISGQHISDNTLTSADIADSAITSGDIANGQTLRSLNNLRDHATLVAGPRLSVTTNPAANQITVGLADTTSSGDITAVTAGPGLSGGGTRGAVTLSLATGGVTSQHLADNAVTGAKIADGTLTNADLADYSITPAKIAHREMLKTLNNLKDNATLVVGSRLFISNNAFNNQITLTLADSISGDITALVAGSGLNGGGTSGALTLGIADAGVTSQHLADNSIISADIADGAVTSADIADGAMASADIADNTITAADLADLGVTLADLAEASVNSAKVVDNTLTSADILDGTLMALDIASGQALKSLNSLRDNVTLVGGDNVAIASDPNTNQITIGFSGSGAGVSGGSGQITALNAGSGLSGGGTTGALTLGIANAGVTTLHLADLNVTSPKIAEGAVTSNKIADGAVTSAKIADNAINAAKISDNTLTAADVLDGTLTAADITSGQVVKSLNNLMDNVTLVGDDDIAISSNPATNQISIAFSEAGSSAVWRLGGNTGVSSGMFVGTRDTTTVEFRVDNDVALRLFRGAYRPNFVAGAYTNGIAYGYTPSAAAIGGGEKNTVGGYAATIGGGTGNRATGDGSTVSGGSGNVSSGVASSVAGGSGNMADGVWSFVAGGSSNKASGDISFAAGKGANIDAAHDGVFLFSDGHTFHAFNSAAANEFAARATGGVRFVTAINNSDGTPTAGVQLPAGGSAWQTLSDRNAKQHFQVVDTRRLLEKLAALPIQTWSYKTQADSIRHLGPMAQDFRAAFGLGEDQTHISTVDADGVALAAIQGLYLLAQEQQGRIAALQEQVDAQARQLATLQAQQALLQDLRDRLAALEKAPPAGLNSGTAAR